MAQMLHHKESGLHGKETQGRRWSFLQFFGLRRLPRSMKMLSDKKHGQEKSTGVSRLRGCYVPLKDEDSDVTDDHKNTQDRDKQKGSKKNSGKTSLKSLISRKFYGKEGHKEKMLPVAPRLLRTLSIHYLESNVYVFDGESAPRGDGSSHGAKHSQQNATGTNLQNNTLDGSDSDVSFSRLLSRGEEHVKRKSHRSISMDGILHKVPYGSKVAGDTIIEELPRSVSATYDRDGLKPFTSRRHLNQGFQRSRSLSESLESYSHLLESISSREAKRVLTSSKSTRDHSLDGSGVTTELQRSSSSQHRSKGLTRFAEYLVIPEDGLASQALDKIVVDGDVKSLLDESSCNNEITGGSENPMSLEEYLSDEKGDAAASAEASFCIAPIISSEVVDIAEEHSVTACVDDQVLPSTEVSLCTDPSRPKVDIPEEDEPTLLSLLQSEDIGSIVDQHSTLSDNDVQSCTAQPSEDTSIAEENPMVSNDNHIQSFEDSSSVEENIVHPNEADDSVGSLTDDEDVQENSFGGGDDRNDFYFQAADPKKEAVLRYVKDMFSKSSFSNETLFDAWRSQNIAALQDEGCQPNELSFAADGASDLAIADMCADEFLLFDLTNEALLDMYRKYAARSPFSYRPKPVGRDALRELCSRVSRQLDDRQAWSGVDVDGLLSIDLAKADRWAEFPGVGVEVGAKVADMVLDRLVTELALQLAKF
uniref:Uncharacterized protein n=1 Tax=Avena sativa TaxID=4498 RepID=A0ACD5V9F8_AVESA